MHLDEFRRHHDAQCQSDEDMIGAAYAKDNPHLEHLGISSQHFGDICKGVRRPGPKLARKLVDWSDGKITIVDLYDFYENSERKRSAPSVSMQEESMEVVGG